MKNILSIFLLLNVFNATAQDINSLKIQFDSQSTNLDLKSEIILDEFVVKLQSQQIDRLFLECFSLEELSSQKGMQLTESRNDFLIDYFEDFNIKLDRITFFTSKEHVAFETTNIENWHFVILKYSFKKEAKEIVEQDLSTSIFKTDSQNKNTYQINNANSHRLKLKKGTFLKIPDQAFVKLDGSPVIGSVIFEAEEIFDIESAVLHEVVTQTTDGAYLKSKGMLKLEAFDNNGNELKLAKSKSLDISIKAKEGDDLRDFNIYRGVKNPDGLTQWILDTTKIEIIEKPLKRRLLWKRMSKAERNKVTTRRIAYVEEMEEKGRKNINKLLRRYKKIRRKRYKRMKERANHKERFTRRDKDYSELRKMQILSNAKFRWQEDTSYHSSTIRVMRFQSLRLGMINIDAILIPTGVKKISNLMVENNQKYDVRIFLKNNFSLIKGEYQGGKATFKRLPFGVDIIILGMKKQEGNKIEFTYLDTNTTDLEHQFGEAKILSQAQVLNKVSSLRGR